MLKDPKVSRVNFNAFPVISLSVASKNESLATLTENVEKNVVPGLKGLDGVASVQIAGQQVDEVQLVFKKDKMKELGLSEDTVKMLLRDRMYLYHLAYTHLKTRKNQLL